MYILLCVCVCVCVCVCTCVCIEEINEMHLAILREEEDAATEFPSILKLLSKKITISGNNFLTRQWWYDVMTSRPPPLPKNLEKLYVFVIVISKTVLVFTSELSQNVNKRACEAKASAFILRQFSKRTKYRGASSGTSHLRRRLLLLPFFRQTTLCRSERS